LTKLALPRTSWDGVGMSPTTASGRPKTVIAADPESHQRSMLIEIHPEMDGEAEESDLHAFQRRMFNGNVSVGLLVTRGWMYVIRDLLTTMEYATNNYEVNKLETAMLMKAAGLGSPKFDDAFGFQVRTWLDAVARAWNLSLPREAIPFMIPDVVGNLASAKFETQDDLLAFGDAA
jgi:hypothetical protein